MLRRVRPRSWVIPFLAGVACTAFLEQISLSLGRDHRQSGPSLLRNETREKDILIPESQQLGNVKLDPIHIAHAYCAGRTLDFADNGLTVVR